MSTAQTQAASAAPKMIRFTALTWPTAILSVIVMLVSLVSLATQQVNFALDFTGGTEMRLGFAEPTDPAWVRERLETAGISAVVKQYGSERDLLVQMRGEVSREDMDAVVSNLRVADVAPTVHSADLVGPQVGGELRTQGLLAMLVSMLLMMIYVGARFQFKFAFAVVAALIHDVVFTLGIYSVFRWEFDLTVLAAVLALIGYSINDSIVIFDRIRENFPKYRKMSAREIIDLSLTQTLNRTIITAVTLMLVLVAMLVVGGPGLYEFSRALLIGVFVGIYSTIYVASTILILTRTSAQDLVKPEKDRRELEAGVV